jgi:hypothetical protein
MSRRIVPNFFKAEALYVELLFRMTLYFIHNKYYNITCARNPPSETILPTRISMHRKMFTQNYRKHLQLNTFTNSKNKNPSENIKIIKPSLKVSIESSSTERNTEEKLK